MTHVLFVCVGNSARSQMAEGLLDSLTPAEVTCASAGTRPAKRVSSKSMAVMAEIGIDLTQNTPPLLTPEMTKKASKIITMGCLDDSGCPSFIIEENNKREDWKIPDPRGLPLDEYRKVRDLISSKIGILIRELPK